MWSAPAAAASCALCGLLTVAITVASAQRASWMAALPTAPAPPWTSTVCPVSEPGRSRSGSVSATVRQRCAVRNGMPSAAPSSKLGSGPSRTTCRAGTTVYSAAVPHRRRGGRDDGVLGGGAPRPLVGRLPDPDALADQHGVDALAGGVDGAGAVLVGDLPVRTWLGTGAGLPVGRVDPGEGEADPHLAGPGLGNRAVAQLEDVGAA